MWLSVCVVCVHLVDCCMIVTDQQIDACGMMCVSCLVIECVKLCDRLSECLFYRMSE